MTHSQGSNSVAKHSALIVSHPRPGPFDSVAPKILRSSSSTLGPIPAFPFSRLLPALPSQQGSHIAAPASSTPARSRWPEADPTNTTVTQSYHRGTALTQKAEVERTGGHISRMEPSGYSSMISRARACARAQGGVIGGPTDDTLRGLVRAPPTHPPPA
jgi:hypothetical protein